MRWSECIRGNLQTNSSHRKKPVVMTTSEDHIYPQQPLDDVDDSAIQPENPIDARQPLNDIDNLAIQTEAHSYPRQPMDDIDDPVILPEEYPMELSGTHYDGVFIATARASTTAGSIRETVTQNVVLNDGTRPQMAVYTVGQGRAGDFSLTGTRIATLEQVLKRCTFYFILITEDFERDGWATVAKEECIEESLQDPTKKWSVVPMICEQCRSPYGLRALEPVNVSFELSNNNDGAPSQSEFIETMTKLLQSRLHQRRARERVQQARLNTWIEDEVHRRRQQLLQALEDDRRKQRERERVSERTLRHMDEDMHAMNLSASLLDERTDPDSQTSRSQGAYQRSMSTHGSDTHSTSIHGANQYAASSSRTGLRTDPDSQTSRSQGAYQRSMSFHGVDPRNTSKHEANQHAASSSRTGLRTDGPHSETTINIFCRTSSVQLGDHNTSSIGAAPMENSDNTSDDAEYDVEESRDSARPGNTT